LSPTFLPFWFYVILNKCLSASCVDKTLANSILFSANDVNFVENENGEENENNNKRFANEAAVSAARSFSTAFY
jgi:hypothetical protein